ncbi:longevity assurance proteins LAG1/LAC1 [Suhomyces tanzawaensis NRRL Y-17324]|uniref:Longevity assurance proteins LAG1/LAC1 n=1 Tax=Suhomyces tanzawaensis NRRL Y-17324 TaxID=984487 RepID=A0A1E4SI92_9ASCO|nr:longevity assurance proteins LAG1/LAC1 [Suhomyces tanzawaensis NRRL Y-17324]ODV79239.1 longevity assurance proteins LAG1/LAC1 [Suhomyces tanzawaensis NRRL Y-17324]
MTTDNAEYHKSFLASVERNQMHISRLLLTSLFALNMFQAAQPYTSKFISLQYEESLDPLLYGIGIDDTYYVVTWVIGLTFLRSFLMTWCFSPFSSVVLHIHSRKAKVRFAEQSWSFVYYTISFLFGVYLYIGAPYYNNIDNLYIAWPHDHYTHMFKTYYLAQVGFWIQQIFVLNVEERRKDHYQMFSHHIITCLLLIGSYYYHFTRIGHLILMIMDSVDIFLAAAKMLKYAGFSTMCDIMFLMFLVSWIVLRHGVYNVLFYHAWFYSTDLMLDGQCSGVPQTTRCWTPTVIKAFLGLLGGLQIITIVWMYLILKVAYKVITGKGAEDVRSDDEDTDHEGESKPKADTTSDSEKEKAKVEKTVAASEASDDSSTTDLDEPSEKLQE